MCGWVLGFLCVLILVGWLCVSTSICIGWHRLNELHTTLCNDNNTGLDPCNKRSPLLALKAQFGHVDFSEVRCSIHVISSIYMYVYANHTPK